MRHFYFPAQIVTIGMNWIDLVAMDRRVLFHLSGPLLGSGTVNSQLVSVVAQRRSETSYQYYSLYRDYACAAPTLSSQSPHARRGFANIEHTHQGFGVSPPNIVVLW